MKPVLLLMIPLVAVLGCSVFKSGKDDEPNKKVESTAPKLVGRIASIPQGKKFVLIQSYERWTVEPGTILTTRGPEERTANLLATGESLGQFAAADLQSGTLEVGDAVYSRHVPKPPATPGAAGPNPELPDSQQNPSPENVQKNN